jgi:hypothetical protein
VSYTDRLQAELAGVGIRGRLARRIVLELEDHLASERLPGFPEAVTVAEALARRELVRHAGDVIRPR